jgi:hypothetical protein
VTDEDPGRSLFAGGGEVGRAMAETDWSQTPLGPPEQWPSGLRHTVRILLTSRFAMWAGWGPELSFFYNDAYRHDTLQTKHPVGAGPAGVEVWAEIWHDIGPRTCEVLDSGTATWDEDLLLFLERSGYPRRPTTPSPTAPCPATTAHRWPVLRGHRDHPAGRRGAADGHAARPRGALGAARTEAGVLAAVEEQLSRNPATCRSAPPTCSTTTGRAGLGSVTGVGRGARAARRC